jgi:hypothetical protein
MGECPSRRPRLSNNDFCAIVAFRVVLRAERGPSSADSLNVCPHGSPGHAFTSRLASAWRFAHRPRSGRSRSPRLKAATLNRDRGLTLRAARLMLSVERGGSGRLQSNIFQCRIAEPVGWHMPRRRSGESVAGPGGRRASFRSHYRPFFHELAMTPKPSKMHSPR